MPEQLSVTLAKGVLSRYVGCLLRQDREGVLELLSEDFGRHKGLDKDGFVDRELEDFAYWSARQPIAGVRIQIVRILGRMVEFALVDGQGRLVYDDFAWFDDRLRIVGNQIPFEFVTKLSFTPFGVRRGMAIRENESRLGGIAPVDTRVVEQSFRPADTFGGDPYATYSFRIPGDDLASLTATFAMRTDAGEECHPLFLRGSDHPLFIPDGFPAIEGDLVSVPDRGPPAFALEVTTRDGETVHLDAPAPGLLRFGGPVEKAVLTDALDNDWTVFAT